VRLRTLKEEVLDFADRFRGRSTPLRPPRRLLSHWGEAEGFHEAGARYVRHFVEIGGLRPEHTVLEVGCGIGRMAIALTSFMGSGTYDGFDVAPQGVRWCQRNVTPLDRGR
jgi:cyclopropane fatty-acyl-phospholipid synthase-like methyltransferase